jgi:hypothetical protein
VIPRPRKLLAAAPLLAAALAGCGTTSAPAARSAAMAAPVREPMVTRPLVLSEAAPSPGLMNATPVAAAVEAPPAPQVAATPLCDSNGRPLSGNIKTKVSPRECTADEIRTAAATPGTE